jgi:ribosomal protein S18 acetylase RimI-like enzyme
MHIRELVITRDWSKKFNTVMFNLVARSVGLVGGIHMVMINNHTAYIRSVYVHPAYQNNGWGSKLIKKSIDAAICKGASYVELDDCLSNPNSTLYLRQGFYKKYPDGDNEMIKIL